MSVIITQTQPLSHQNNLAVAVCKKPLFFRPAKYKKLITCSSAYGGQMLFYGFFMQKKQHQRHLLLHHQ